MSERKIQSILSKLAKLRQKRQATSAEVGINSVEAIRLEREGLLRRVSTVQTGRQGRPAVIWGLTDKAHKRVKRAIASGRIQTA